MNFRRILTPRYCFDRAIGRLWSYAPELRRPDKAPALRNPLAVCDIHIHWPKRYGWAPGFRWVDSIRSGLSRYVDVHRVDIPQLPNTAIAIHVLFRGKKHKVIIDYTDKHDTIWHDYLRDPDCFLYFKMQFRNKGYDDPRIVPGQYVPSDGTSLNHYLPRLRQIRDSVDQVYEVYGRFGLQQGSDIRPRAVSILNAQREFRYQGGGKMLAATRSLCEVARSRICIDLPGRGPFCHRLVEYMSIGSCIVAYPHEAILCPPLVPGKHIVYCRPDFSDLVEICQYYLTHDQERLAMVHASREYYDTYLHKDCIAAYYLECIAARLGLHPEEAATTVLPSASITGR